MSRTVTYNRYTINSIPIQNVETGPWQLKISISYEQDGTPISKPYWMPIACPTEGEAHVHGITFGQRIIDGKVPGISLD